jgi:DNA-binding HxlR family transcriptional regulator
MYSKHMNVTQEIVGNVDAATAILGNKWTPLLLKSFLNEGEVRFCQIQNMVGGINPRTLCARLDDLETSGIIVKEACDDSSRCTYKLTDKGRDLLPILQQMQEWTAKYPESCGKLN